MMSSMRWISRRCALDVIDKLNCKFGELDELMTEFHELDKLNCKSMSWMS